MKQTRTYGIIDHPDSHRATDYLYRISLKCMVTNKAGEVLVVKETGRSWWDLPGGGMDHGENLTTAIAREMKEEVNMQGDFLYEILAVDEPAYLEVHNFWQLRLIFAITPTDMAFNTGKDSDEIAFMAPEIFQNSVSEVERRIYKYASMSPQNNYSQTPISEG